MNVLTPVVCAFLVVISGAGVNSNTDRVVAELIEQMTDPETQMEAFSELEALGCEAVPSVILRLDDRRELPISQISLENKSPDTFERIRHYGPDLVADALAAILNQVTGASFGFIYNGATDEERDATITEWRRYLERAGPDNVCRDASRTN